MSHLDTHLLYQPMLQLRESIMQFYLVYREHRPEYPVGELRRRQRALDEIKEHLDFRPLESFAAEHLEVLVLLFAYWRELEIDPPFWCRCPPARPTAVRKSDAG